ncbi:MAG: hypothetical protein IKU81_06265 [Oscillibacter sp.]|nr:hypothetical protein [Oscillibacter sp.]
MAKGMKICAAGSAAAGLVCALLYLYLESGVMLTLAITFVTTAYHFDMRLLVGTIVNGIFHNRMDYTRKWFRLRPFEATLYAALHVKQWKGKLPTYAPEWFSLRTHSPQEIAQAMCQAEIVHEIIVVLSFLPLCVVPRFGSLWVFLITSLLAAGFDLLFVIVQRYNRPRVLRLAGKRRRNLDKTGFFQ